MKIGIFCYLIADILTKVLQKCLTFQQSFSFMPLMASKEMIFLNIFREINLSVAMATNQIQRFGQNSSVW